MYWCLGTACCLGPAHYSLLQRNLWHGTLLPYLRCLPLVQASHLRKAAEICPSPVFVAPGRAAKQGRDMGNSTNVHALSKDHAPDAKTSHPSFQISSLLNPSDSIAFL